MDSLSFHLVQISPVRSVEAATSNCSTTLLTDLWFSYDADGRVTRQWERTPNSGQYYQSVATFFGNGAVNTLQLASPSEYTMTYGIDGEGRWSSVKSSSTQSYVTGTTYNAASQPTEIPLTGTGPDQDDYVYDPNTGRMKMFTFQVGTTPATMVGQLYWNPNGTLNNLAITDGFNAGGTQTCYYNPSSGSGMGYDDLGRLLNVSCGASGSVWNQTFSYDQYDNITKSSSGPGVSWMPGYSSSTNHYTLAGTTYDSDGNLTDDSFHNYQWNEFAKIKSVDQSGTNCATSGECIVYDALGRAVEIDNGSKYTEIWYTQLGKTAYMNGSTINYAYWPMPGGGTELIGASNWYMHKDWLGNARILSTTNGHAVSADIAFAPYGEIYDQFGATGTQYQMFTGDTQDIVSGTMDTPNREYNSGAQGRWVSPDPAGAGWSAYAYQTNPLSLIDPSGLSPYPGQCHVCWDDIGDEGGGENPSFGLFGAYMTLSQSGFTGWGCGMCNDDVGSGGSTVGADSALDILSGPDIGDLPFASFNALALMLAMFQEAPEPPEEDAAEPPEEAWGAPLEPLSPEETIPEPWRYNLLTPGPLPPQIAGTFSGGQYSPMIVGEEGWSFDAVWRVNNVGSDLEGSNGTFYSPVPQVGGTQSAIDLAVNPNWGAAGTPGGNPYSNGLDLGNVTCVSLQPGQQVFVGPIGSQGGAWVGGLPGNGGLQIYVPPRP